MQIAAKPPTPPRKLHLTCMLIDVFHAIIAECEDPLSPSLTKDISCKILLLWLPSATCEICGGVTRRSTSEDFLPFKGCPICGQSHAIHHSQCCAEREEAAHPRFADLRGRREFIMLLKFTLSQEPSRPFNHSALDGPILNYTPYVMSHFLDPA